MIKYSQFTDNIGSDQKILPTHFVKIPTDSKKVGGGGVTPLSSPPPLTHTHTHTHTPLGTPLDEVSYNLRFKPPLL